MIWHSFENEGSINLGRDFNIKCHTPDCDVSTRLSFWLMRSLTQTLSAQPSFLHFKTQKKEKKSKRNRFHFGSMEYFHINVSTCNGSTPTKKKTSKANYNLQSSFDMRIKPYQPTWILVTSIDRSPQWTECGSSEWLEEKNDRTKRKICLKIPLCVLSTAVQKKISRLRHQ